MSDDDLFKEFDSQTSTSKYSPQHSKPTPTATTSKPSSTSSSHSTGTHTTKPTPQIKTNPTPAPVKSELDDFADFDSPTTDGISLETMMKAQKFAKQAVSALQFSDAQSARNALKQALDLLQ